MLCLLVKEGRNILKDKEELFSLHSPIQSSFNKYFPKSENFKPGLEILVVNDDTEFHFLAACRQMEETEK